MFSLVGVLADIHGDLQALDAALPRLRAMGCDVILCAGDCIDFEVFGEEVCQRLKAEKGLICIVGNHERWALQRRRRRPDMRRFGQQPCDLPDLFGGGTELSRESLVWLASLTSHWEGELEGVRVAMWHARPGSDMQGIEGKKTGPELRRRLLEQAHADVLIVGHTHEPFELAAGSGKILNPGPCCGKLHAYKQVGALAVPDGFQTATFGVLELPSMRFEVFRALDGERVLGTSPDRPSIRPPRRPDG